jgi:hypothetical protein
MTRDEILSLEPGKQTDAAVAVAMGWKQVGRGNIWRDGKRIIRKWQPSTDWSDTGYLIDRIIANPFRALYQISKQTLFYCKVEATDHLGPGPLPFAIFRATADDPQMAVCRAFLLMQYGLYDSGGTATE